MTDDMTSFELQQEVDRILNRADKLTNLDASTPETSSSNAFEPFQKLDHNTENRKKITFKVRKVSRETDKATDDGRLSENKKKHLKTVQLQYDQCVNKIEKIQKEINFLKNLLPPYNVEVDYHTRVKITKAIEKLKMKIDEMDKKKYSLGISLSRLWRDFDDSDIWVRTVSNS